MRKSLSLLTATTIVIGSIIGSGIFKKTAAMASVLPSMELVMLAWVVGAAVTFAGALCAAELASAYPDAGGLYAYLCRAYGPAVGYLYGWAVFAVIQTGSIASIAYVFAQYLRPFIGWPDPPAELANLGTTLFGFVDIYPFKELWTKVAAAICILAVTIANVLGVRLGALVQNAFTSAKLLLIAVIVFAVLTLGGAAPQYTQSVAATASAGGKGLLLAFFLALSGAFWAYDGWINVTYVAEEVRDPGRNLPKALGVGLLVVLGTYLFLNLAYFAALPLDRIAHSTLVAADALGTVVPWGATFASVAVVVSTFGTVNGTALSSARVYFAMSREGLFPAALSRVHPRYGTPHVSLWVQCAWSCLLLLSGTFDQLTDMLIFVSFVFYGLLALAVPILRRRYPSTKPRFRVPLYPYLPSLFVAFCAAYLVASVWGNTRNALLGSLLVVLGIPFYLYYKAGKAEGGTI